MRVQQTLPVVSLRLGLVLAAAAPALAHAQGPTHLADTLAYTTTAVRLRVAPNTDAEILTVLAPGTRVATHECPTSWCWVDDPFSGNSGYVAARLLTLERPVARPVKDPVAQPVAESSEGGGVLLVLVILVALTWAVARSLSRAPQSRAFAKLLNWAPQLGTMPRSLTLFQFRSVIVPDERGTTEIDVILVGNAGVFVIELKKYNAWIFGSEDDDKWTARYVDGSSHQFQNPLRQNYRHVMALVSRLGLPRDKFHSLVAFSGDCEFKTPMPPYVLKGDYESVVRQTDGILLTDADVSKACEILRALESGSTAEAFDEHVERLHERFASTTTCPKCGSPLVERRSTKATSDGEPFLGCRAYPRCTYLRKLNAA